MIRRKIRELDIIILGRHMKNNRYKTLEPKNFFEFYSVIMFAYVFKLQSFQQPY